MSKTFDRHVVAGLRSSESWLPPTRILSDISKRFVASTQTLRTQEDRDAHRRFWGRFLPKDFAAKAPKRGYGAKAWAEVFLNSLPFLQQFYWPEFGFEENTTFPGPCDYEAIIPFESENLGFFRFMIVKAGAKLGSTVVAAQAPRWHALSPSIVSAVSSLVPEVRKLASAKGRLARADHEKLVKGHTNLTRAQSISSLFSPVRFKELCASLDYGWFEITEKAYLRLPCYNIPLQCFFDMAFASIGDCRYDNKAVFRVMVRKNLKTLTLKRKPIDMTLFTAIFLWPTWEQYHFKPAERLDHLRQTLIDRGVEPAFNSVQYEALRIRCYNLFKAQMRRNQNQFKD